IRPEGAQNWSVCVQDPCCNPPAAAGHSRRSACLITLNKPNDAAHHCGDQVSMEYTKQCMNMHVGKTRSIRQIRTLPRQLDSRLLACRTSVGGHVSRICWRITKPPNRRTAELSHI